jgi:hypothetical protein
VFASLAALDGSLSNESQEATMNKLIASSEFGDWLLGEISETGPQPKSVDSDGVPNPPQRLETLMAAKKLLAEYLTLQKKMLAAARMVREYRS